MAFSFSAEVASRTTVPAVSESFTHPPVSSVASSGHIILDTSIMVDSITDDLYVSYVNGTSSASNMDVYFKVSKDDGSTWNTQTLISNSTSDVVNVRDRIKIAVEAFKSIK